jgi:MscS family membrane protein
MNMKEIADRFELAFLAESWFQQTFLIVLATVMANFLARALFRRAAKLAQQTTSPWDDAVVLAAKGPVPLIIWLVGIAFAANIIGKESHAEIFEVVSSIRNLGVVICLAWFAIRFIRNATFNIIDAQKKNEENVDHTTVDALSKLARLTVIIFTVIVVMQTMGFSVSGLLAAGGIGGIAIGFAAKDLLANFFGGLTIYLDRPFSVGDWIRSPDKAIEGTVEFISWRHTRIRGFNKNPIYVPNALFTTIVVENPSRMTNRRIKETIGIRYDDIGVMDKIVSEVKAMLKAHPDIDVNQTLIVNFNAFGPSSLDFFIYTFTKTTEWTRYHEVKQDVLLNIATIIDQHGAQIAFTTQTVHLAPSATLL